MKTKQGKMLLASAAAGLMTLALTAGASTAHAGDAPADGKVKCYGVNSCKGTAECGGKGHGCAGKNECKGQGWVSKASAEECLKIAGGRLTPEAK